MQKIRNLYDFVNYCEGINEDNNDFFLISLLTATINQEELLADVRESLTVYYKWLKEAVDGEFFLFAETINKAHKAEIDHYIKLSKSMYKNSLKKEIKAIDEELKAKYL